MAGYITARSFHLNDVYPEVREDLPAKETPFVGQV
jgi:hypothetical protein